MPTPPGSRPPGIWEAPSLEAMQALLSQYEFISLLGRGGMGAVYKARQISLDRTVAIKVLPGDLLDDTDVNFVQRFKQEARTMARMNHPAIVSVYDFGETRNGLLYFVMEFVDGTDVAQMILAQRRLPSEHALAITAHVCDALAYAHAHGVVHRDIKPANVLINVDGQVKVADFGLAKANDGSDHGLTKTNMAMGTPDFVAPEALIPGIPLDGRADLYAVGVMLYQMLTGEIPRGLWQMPSLKVGADRRFDNIIAKAMQTDREMRYQSSQEIRQDLDRIVTMPIVQAGGETSAAIPKQAVAAQARKSAAKNPQASEPRKEEPPPSAPAKKTGSGLLMAQGFGAATAIVLFFVLRPSAPETASKEARAAIQPPPAPSPAVRPVTVTNTPPPPAKAESAPWPPGVAKRSIDLLALVDPVKDRVSIPLPGVLGANEWTREGGALVFKSDGKAGKIAAPVNLICSDYEIELKAEKRSGTSRLHLDLPMKDGSILPLLLHDPDRAVVHEKAGKTWPKSAQSIHITARLRLSPDPGSDRILIQRKDNGDVLADWIGDARALAKNPEKRELFPEALLTTLFSKDASYVIQTWTLRVFDGSAEVLRPPLTTPVTVALAPRMPAAPDTAAPAPSTSPPASTPVPDPVSARLLEIETQFQDALKKQVDSVHQSAVADLNAKYLAALDRSIAAASQASNLDEALLLRAEKTSVQNQIPVPPEDAENAPAALKSVRETYRKTMAGLAANREKLAAPLYAAYDRVLTGYQDELTRNQKLDEAQRVKAVRDYVTAQRDAGSISSTPSVSPVPGAASAALIIIPAAPRLTADKVLPLPPRATPAEVREFASWVIETKRGYVRLLDGGQVIQVDNMDRVPRGKFTLLGFNVHELRPDDDKKWVSLMARIPELEEIYFNLISGHFPMEELRGLTKLKSVRLAPRSVDDAAFAHLTGLKNLESLHITHWCQQFTGAGLGYINENLTELNTDSDSLTADGMAYLPRFKKLKSLTMYDCPTLTDAMLQGLSVMSALQDLNLNQNRLDGSFLAHLPANSQLKSLYLAQNAVFKPENFAQITRLKNLRRLDMPPLNFTPADLAPIASLTTLEELNFTLNNAFTGEAFKGLKGFDSVGIMNLAGCPLTDAGLGALATAIPKLHGIDLQGRGKGRTTYTVPGLSAALSRLRDLRLLVADNPDITDDWLAHIGQLRSLTTLSLRGTGITDAGLAHLKGLDLVELRLSNTAITDASIPVLITFSKLNTLYLDSTQMTPEGIAQAEKNLAR